MNLTPFERGFQAVTGRVPTPDDYNTLQKRRTQQFRAQYPDEPSTLEKVAAYAAPILGAYATRAAMSDGPTWVGQGLGAIKDALFGTATEAAGNAAASSAASSLGGGAVAAPASAGGGVVLPGSVGDGAASSLGSSLSLGNLGTALGLGAGAYGLYKLGDSLSEQGQYQMDSEDLLKSTGSNALTGAAAGAAIGSAVPGVGTLVGGLIGGLLGGGTSAGINIFGSGKSQDQLVRDELRSIAQGANVLDDNYMSNGVDLGKDGGFKFGDGRRIYEIVPSDTSNGAPIFSEDQANAIGMLAPLGALISRGDDKYQNQFTSMLVNAAQEGGDAGITNSEIRQMYDRTGLGQGDIFEGVNELYRQGRISEDEARAQQNALNQLYGQEYYSPTNEEERQRSVLNMRNRFFA